MLKKLTAWVCLLGAVSVVAACGKSESSSGPIPKAELPARLAKIACEGLAGCCKTAALAFDLATCKQAYTARLKGDIKQLNSPNIDYDAAAAGECVDAIDGHSQCGEFEDNNAPACERVFRGKLAIGSLCTDSDECRGNPGQRVNCTSSDGLAPEVCTLESSTPSVHGKEGDACFTTCNEGRTCDFGSEPSPGIAAPGDPVSMPAPQAACYRAEGLWCDSTSGTCARLAQVGFPCSYESCVGDAFCDPERQVCTTPRDIGAPCTSRNECQSHICGEDSGGPVMGDPGVSAPTRYCAARRTVTANDCSPDFSTGRDSTDPSSPGSSAPQPQPPAP